MSQNFLPTQAVEAQLFHAEELEERIEFAAWDPPGDWGGEVECTIKSDGTQECMVKVIVTRQDSHAAALATQARSPAEVAALGVELPGNAPSPLPLQLTIASVPPGVGASPSRSSGFMSRAAG